MSLCYLSIKTTRAWDLVFDHCVRYKCMHVCIHVRWLDSLVAKAVVSGREFEPRPLRGRVTTLGKLFTQMGLWQQAVYFGRWRYLAGKVTVGLVESNGSLPPGGWLKIHLRADCLYTGSVSGSTLDNEYERTLHFYLMYACMYVREAGLVPVFERWNHLSM